MEPLRIPLFPLPDTVLFPGTVLPLHVFEPRYRQMVADCLAGDGRVAVVRLRPGWEGRYEGRPPVSAVAGLGEILQAEALPDGRYNILVDGRARIRIESEEPPGDCPYRIARARLVPEPGSPPATGRFVDGVAGLRAAHLKLLATLGQSHADLVARITTAGASAGGVIDRIVSAAVPDAAVRQRVLEAVDLEERLDLAAAALSALLALVSGGADDDEAPDE